MKILHTADWHLGKYLGTISRHEEQVAVLDEICQVADSENVDAIVVAGDLFDAFNPPVESVELLYKTLKRLAMNGQRAVIAIAGNHDSPDRIEAPDPLARACGILFIGYPQSKLTPFSIEGGISLMQTTSGFAEIKLPNCKVPLRLLLTPYANEQRLRAYLGIDNRENQLRSILQSFWSGLASKHCDDKGVNILVSHLFMMKKGGTAPEETDDEKPIVGVGGAQAVYSENIPSQVQYVALGHIHRKQEISADPCPVLYSGSPLAYSMKEAEQQKFVLIIEAEPDTRASVRQVSLKQGKKLVRKEFKSVGPALNWLQGNPDVLVELTMATDTYLTAEERKQLYATHNGIVDIVPIVELGDAQSAGTVSQINLRLSVPDLFKEYFQHTHNQMPNKSLMDLLAEVIAAEEE